MSIESLPSKDEEHKAGAWLVVFKLLKQLSSVDSEFRTSPYATELSELIGKPNDFYQHLHLVATNTIESENSHLSFLKEAGLVNAEGYVPQAVSDAIALYEDTELGEHMRFESSFSRFSDDIDTLTGFCLERYFSPNKQEFSLKPCNRLNYAYQEAELWLAKWDEERTTG